MKLSISGQCHLRLSLASYHAWPFYFAVPSFYSKFAHSLRLRTIFHCIFIIFCWKLPFHFQILAIFETCWARTRPARFEPSGLSGVPGCFRFEQDEATVHLFSQLGFRLDVIRPRNQNNNIHFPFDKKEKEREENGSRAC